VADVKVSSCETKVGALAPLQTPGFEGLQFLTGATVGSQAISARAISQPE